MLPLEVAVRIVESEQISPASRRFGTHGWEKFDRETSGSGWRSRSSSRR